MDSNDARRCRDITLGCAGRLAACAGYIQENLADPFARECRVACGHAIVELGALVNAIVGLCPELKLTDDEWKSVEVERAGRGVVELDDNPCARLLLDVGTIEDRILVIHSIAPELAGPVSDVIRSLGAFTKLLCRDLSPRQRP